MNQTELIIYLRKELPRGARLYTLTTQGRGAMRRYVRAFRVSPEGDIEEITGLVARAIGVTYNPDRPGIKREGCGYDAGAEVVSDLAYALHGDARALLQRGL